MELIHFGVGNRLEVFATHANNFIIDYNDSGFTLLCLMDKPNKSEKAQFASLNDFQITFTDILGVGFFCVKVGNLPWGDAPFSPNIYATKPSFPPLNPGMGYACNLILIDSSCGEVQSIRMIGLGSEFSSKFREWAIGRLTIGGVDKRAYDSIVNMAFSRYSTKELVERAWLRWSLEDK